MSVPGHATSSLTVQVPLAQATTPSLAMHAPLVNANAQLIATLVEFNLHVARIAHPSWVPPALRRVVYDGQGVLKPEAERSLSDWLLDEHDLRRHMDWQMHEPEKHVWLLDGASLSRLALELSVLLHREWLVRVIDGAYLRKLSAQVDPALLRSLANSVPHDAPCYSEPQVSFTAAAADDVGANLRADGVRVLLSLLNPLWRAVYGRAHLRLDARLTASDAGSGHTPWGATAHAQPSAQLPVSTSVQLSASASLQTGVQLPSVNAQPGVRQPADVPLQASAHECARESILHFIGSWLIPRRFPQWAWLF